VRKDLPALIRRVAWRAAHEFGGDEICTLEKATGGWRLSGDVAIARAGRPARIDYSVELDGGWHTRRTIARFVGRDASAEFRLESNGRGQWTSDGRPFPSGDGCVDVDLGWTPATNTLPIRRLGLSPGERSPIRVVWIRYPELELVAADQVYECLAPDRYRYSSGSFSADLLVDDVGLVVEYEGLWRSVPVDSVARPTGPGSA
jgi:hypothetical protein